MKPFATLLDRLLYTPQRGVKLRLMEDYFRATPDPDRGWGLAALTGALAFKNAKPTLIRDLVGTRVDPVLFAWSHDFVGDLAETAALVWPERPTNRDWPRLVEVVTTLDALPKRDLPDEVGAWLDALDANGRWALLKLITGSLRVGASARLAKSAVAALGPVPVEAVEEAWHGLAPPYAPLFAWLEGKAPRPDHSATPVFRPLMLAHPLEAEDRARIDPDAYAAEWKWDGIRVQISSQGGEVRLFSRTGDDISPVFPDIEAAVNFAGVVDGELLVRHEGVGLGSFNDLQQRLGRKAVTPKVMAAYPAFVHLYDILYDGTEDVRALPYPERRTRLEALFARHRPARMDLPPPVPFKGLAELDALRLSCEGTEREGVMLKRKDSPYTAGRPKGPWFKWKRDPRRLDCVVMYAQRGHGKRSSFYSDYTFGVWREGEAGDELVPVGKAYSGFTDEELGRLDRWVRDHTVKRYGPVREVAPGLVLEIAFDAAHRSTRHKSGLAMRFPRVARIRWDKPFLEADRIETLERMVEGE